MVEPVVTHFSWPRKAVAMAPRIWFLHPTVPCRRNCVEGSSPALRSATLSSPSPRARRMVWTQNYAPFDSVWLDPLVAALPVVALLGLLATGRVPASRAAAAGLACAVLIAIFVF